MKDPINRQTYVELERIVNLIYEPPTGFILRDIKAELENLHRCLSALHQENIELTRENLGLLRDLELAKAGIK